MTLKTPIAIIMYATIMPGFVIDGHKFQHSLVPISNLKMALAKFYLQQ